jgi:cytochrome c-type biogenesis protein CcmF
MGFQTQKDVSLTPGQEAAIGSYRIVYNGLSTSSEGKKDSVAASVTAYSGNQLLGTMTPSKEFVQGFDSPHTEVSIRSTPAEDLYLILNTWDQQQKVGLKLVINPLVTWIWVGGYVLLLGTITAFWPDAKEKRQEEKRQEEKRLASERSMPEGIRTAGT